MIYLIILLILLVLSLTKDKMITSNRIFYYGIMICMVVIAGGRGSEVGVDTQAYNLMFKDISHNGYLYYVEPGWNYLNIVASKMSLSFNALITVISLITLLPIFILSKKLTTNPYIPIFIYFALHIYCASFNVMRQYASISYVLLVYYFYDNKKWLKAIIAFFIAISIHKSSTLVLPVLIALKYINFSRIRGLGFYLLCAFIIGSVANDSFFSIFATEYSGYIERGIYRESNAAAFIFAFVVGCFSLWLYTLIPNDKRNTMWCNLYVISIFVLLLTFRLQYGARVYVICSISQLYFIPYLFKVNRTFTTNSLKLFVYGYYVVVFMRMWLLNANDIMPYTNIWF